MDSKAHFLFPSNQVENDIANFSEDLILFKQDTGYWRYAFVDVFLKFFIPLANGCLNTFFDIVLTLRSYYGKIYTDKQVEYKSSAKRTIQTQHDNNSALTIVPTIKPKLASSLRAHPFMVSLPRPLPCMNSAMISTRTEPCCTLKILAEPKNSSIRADIVFIHGLHGSIAKTWRQGSWAKQANIFLFERMTRRSVRRGKCAKRTHSVDNADKSTEPDFQINYQNNVHNLYALKQNSKVASSCSMAAVTAEDNYASCWPSDWLPLDCPGVRVIALNYTTEEYMWRPVWVKPQKPTNMIERAHEMTDLLIAHRVGFGHPIVWVGHSKGGLFIKQIIVDAWESDRPALTPLWRSTRGLFFYSVPHQGSMLASIKAPLLARSIELQEVAKDNIYLLDLHYRFLRYYYLSHLPIKVFSFVETALTLLSMFYLRIVGIASADPGIGDICGIHLDHREICKPHNRHCVLYRKLVEMIQKVS